MSHCIQQGCAPSSCLASLKNTVADSLQCAAIAQNCQQYGVFAQNTWLSSIAMDDTIETDPYGNRLYTGGCQMLNPSNNLVLTDQEKRAIQSQMAASYASQLSNGKQFASTPASWLNCKGSNEWRAAQDFSFCTNGAGSKAVVGATQTQTQKSQEWYQVWWIWLLLILFSLLVVGIIIAISCLAAGGCHRSKPIAVNKQTKTVQFSSSS